jgi:hypothetical protein
MRLRGIRFLLASRYDVVATRPVLRGVQFAQSVGRSVADASVVLPSVAGFTAQAAGDWRNANVGPEAPGSGRARPVMLPGPGGSQHPAPRISATRRTCLWLGC